MKKIFLTSTVVICFLAICFLGKYYTSLTSVSNKQELINFISCKENVEKVDIMATKEQDGFLAVYYNNGTENRLSILEEDRIFSNRYEYFGGASGSSNFNAFNFGQSSSWALIVVYGNNSDLKAASYKFSNNGKSYSNEKLKAYVLDIYKIEGTSDISSHGYIYDKNGNEICELS